MSGSATHFVDAGAHRLEHQGRIERRADDRDPHRRVLALDVGDDAEQIALRTKVHQDDVGHRRRRRAPATTSSSALSCMTPQPGGAQPRFELLVVAADDANCAGHDSALLLRRRARRRGAGPSTTPPPPSSSEPISPLGLRNRPGIGRQRRHFVGIERAHQARRDEHHQLGPLPCRSALLLNRCPMIGRLPSSGTCRVVVLRDVVAAARRWRTTGRRAARLRFPRGASISAGIRKPDSVTPLAKSSELTSGLTCSRITSPAIVGVKLRRMPNSL